MKIIQQHVTQWLQYNNIIDNNYDLGLYFVWIWSTHTPTDITVNVIVVVTETGFAEQHHWKQAGYGQAQKFFLIIFWNSFLGLSARQVIIWPPNKFPVIFTEYEIQFYVLYHPIMLKFTWKFTKTRNTTLYIIQYGSRKS